MKPITVVAEKRYEISFTEDAWKDLSSFSQNRDVVLIAPKSISVSFGAALPSQYLMIEVEDGEKQKSIQSFNQVIEKVAAAKFDRNCLIVGVGGGATTDLAGFVAASYLRGVDWIAIPTSLDTEILGLIDENWKKNLAELIYRSIAVKAKVVSDDFRESSLREILNYGHTLGHAIEKHSKYSLRHGEAIALGLRFAAQLSFEFSGLSAKDLDRQNQVLDTLGLNAKYPKESWPELLEIMRSDKKVRGGRIRFVTLSALGTPTRAEGIADQQLEKSFLESIGE